MRPIRATDIDLTPKRHHGYAVILFILGTLLPPLAVAARFGIGSDFWLNLVLTICGYIPGHAHNFYIQNIRNNKTHSRTPKWIQKYGLVDTSTIERHKKRSQWANRYNDYNPRSALEDEPFAEGQEGSNNISDLSGEQGPQDNRERGLWDSHEERFYGQRDDSSSVVTGGSGGGRWHYPANFEDALPQPERKKSKRDKDKKKDRWARTEDAYAAQEQEGSGRRKKSKPRRRKTKVAEDEAVSRVSDDTTEFPEDPEGGLYSDRRPPQNREVDAPRQTDESDIFNHEL